MGGRAAADTGVCCSVLAALVQVAEHGDRRALAAVAYLLFVVLLVVAVAVVQYYY